MSSWLHLQFCGPFTFHFLRCCCLHGEKLFYLLGNFVRRCLFVPGACSGYGERGQHQSASGTPIEHSRMAHRCAQRRVCSPSGHCLVKVLFCRLNLFFVAWPSACWGFRTNWTSLTDVAGRWVRCHYVLQAFLMLSAFLLRDSQVCSRFHPGKANFCHLHFLSSPWCYGSHCVDRAQLIFGLTSWCALANAFQGTLAKQFYGCCTDGC